MYQTLLVDIPQRQSFGTEQYCDDELADRLPRLKGRIGGEVLLGLVVVFTHKESVKASIRATLLLTVACRARENELVRLFVYEVQRAWGKRRRTHVGNLRASRSHCQDSEH